MTPPGRPFRADRVWIAALLVAGLAVRLSPWAAVFREGRVFFVDTDDFYHLRRIMTAAANFPGLPMFDPYLGFPSGFPVNWPPLYDFFVGLLTLVAGLGRPSLRLSQTVAALVPPLAGVATLWLFHRAARRICGRRAALWSLAFAAVLPSLVFYTLLGRPDHHCFENFWFMAALLPILKLIAGGGEEPAAAAWAAAAGAAGVLFWLGSVAFSVILFSFAASELAFPRRPGAPPARAFFWLGAAFLLEAALLLPFCAISRWASNGAVLFDAPSAFQPLMLACCGLGTLGLYWRRVRGRGGRTIVVCAAAFLAAAFLAARGVAALALFASAPLPIFESTSEMQPLLAPFGRWGLAYAGSCFGWAFWALPPLAFFFAHEARRDPAKRLVLAWTALMGALALWQTRYAYHLSLPAVLLFGWGAERAALRLAALAAARGLARPRLWGRAVTLALALALLFPALKNVAALPFVAADSLTGDADLIEACAWIRENTPPTRSLWRDEGAPEYGVYSIHNVGNQVAAIAQRPAAAGNMHFLRRQILDSIAFFFMDGAQPAYDFLRARRFRYLLLSDLVHTGVLPLYARLFHRDGYDFAPRPNGGLPLAPRFLDLVYMRLYVFDGSLARLGGRMIAPADHFRLVHESPRENFGVRVYKVFEVVPGARLAGGCRTGVVEASVLVRTNQGRKFVYRNFAVCGKDGRYAMNLPYAGTYSVVCRGLRRSLSVAEREIEAGTSQVLGFD